MAMKTKLRTQVGNSVKRQSVHNSAGFSAKTLGSDSIPGVLRGAPLVNNRTVDDAVIKRAVYMGNTPGNLNGVAVQPGMEVTLKGNALQYDPPTPASRQMPDKNIISKKSAVAGAPPGDVPNGVLGGSYTQLLS
jgi:hypothetical protein